MNKCPPILFVFMFNRKVDGEHTSSRRDELWACRGHKTRRQSWALTKWRGWISPQVRLHLRREECPGIRRGCADLFFGRSACGRQIFEDSFAVQVQVSFAIPRCGQGQQRWRVCDWTQQFQQKMADRPPRPFASWAVRALSSSFQKEANIFPQCWQFS